jgi:hypothetical protein
VQTFAKVYPSVQKSADAGSGLAGDFAADLAAEAAPRT